jgi:DNA ligase-4
MFGTVKATFDSNPIDASEMLRVQLSKNYIRFGGGSVTDRIGEEGVTHVVVPNEHSSAKSVKAKVTGLARIVGVAWVEKCWEEGTMLDEERFQWG